MRACHRRNVYVQVKKKVARQFNLGLDLDLLFEMYHRLLRGNSPLLLFNFRVCPFFYFYLILSHCALLSVHLLSLPLSFLLRSLVFFSLYGTNVGSIGGQGTGGLRKTCGRKVLLRGRKQAANCKNTFFLFIFPLLIFLLIIFHFFYFSSLYVFISPLSSVSISITPIQLFFVFVFFLVIYMKMVRR